MIWITKFVFKPRDSDPMKALTHTHSDEND